jgi:nitroreductase
LIINTRTLNWFRGILEFSKLVKERRSIHFFTDEPVKDDEIHYIIEAARWAPSAGNVQPTRFLVVRNKENRMKIWESTSRFEGITPQNFIKKAPVHLIVLTDTSAYKGRQSSIRSELFCIQDSSAAIMNLLLAVSDIGLGACWVGLFDEDYLRDSFHIPSRYKPVAIIPVGRTKSKEKPRKRKPLADLMFQEDLE